MNEEIYRQAIDHLEFSPHLYEAVTRRAARRPRRCLRALTAAACVCLLTLVTAFAVSPGFRGSVLQLLRVGSTAADSTQENYTVTTTALDADITYSYLTLPQGSSGADIQDGALFDGQCFWVLQQDNTLRQLPGAVVQREITWDDWDYQLHFAYGSDGEKLYVHQLSDTRPWWTVAADPQDVNAVRLQLIWESDITYGMVRYTELRMDLEDFTLTYMDQRTESWWTDVPPAVAQIEQRLHLLRRSDHAVGEGQRVYFYHKPFVLWLHEASGAVRHIEAPEWGQGACVEGTVYWLGHESGTVYRWDGRSWEGVITGLRQMNHCSPAAGLLVTGVTDSGAQAIADVLSGQLYELPEELGAPTSVFRRSADGPTVLVWEDLFQVRYLAVLDTGKCQLRLLERQSTGGMTKLRGMMDDHRLIIAGSRTDGNVTVEIYDFS